MLNVIPNDIIPMILAQLSVEDLVRFKSVSKSWCALIDDPFFIKEHQKRSELKSMASKCFLISYNRAVGKGAYALCSNGTSTKEASSLIFPFQHQEPERLDFAGSCNGLVCLTTPFYYLDTNIYLWNPSIRQCRAVPDSNFSHYRREIFYGFGFEPGGLHDFDDYKIVKTTIIGKPKRWSEVEVYSLKQNSWKSIGNAFPSQLYYVYRRPLVANGSVHWATRLHEGDDRSMTQPIVSFDMTNEVFKEMMVPDCICHKGWYISTLGKSISIIVSLSSHYGQYEIWVMKEYGVTESWTKLYVTRLGESMITWTIPRGVIESGDAVFSRLGHLISYDPKKEVVDDFGIYTCDDLDEVTSYVESLVWIVPNVHGSGNKTRKHSSTENMDEGS